MAAVVLISGCSGGLDGASKVAGGSVGASGSASTGSASTDPVTHVSTASVAPSGAPVSQPVAKSPVISPVSTPVSTPGSAPAPSPSAAPVAKQPPASAPTCSNPIKITCNGQTTVICAGQSFTCTGAPAANAPPAAAPPATAPAPVASSNVMGLFKYMNGVGSASSVGYCFFDSFSSFMSLTGLSDTNSIQSVNAPPATPFLGACTAGLVLPRNDYFARWVFLDQIHGDIFANTIYQHVNGNEVPAIDYWARNYDPARGVGCRAIVQAFLLAHPLRPLALSAIGAYSPVTAPAGSALFSYIGMEYSAILPGVPSSIYLVDTWGTEGLMSLDAIDAMMLDQGLLRTRCVNAGMQF